MPSTNEHQLDLSIALPSRWRPVSTARGQVEVQAHAPTLKHLRDRARESYGAAYSAGYITGTVLAAFIRADAMCMLSSQSAPVDGVDFAVAVAALINHLTVEE